MVNFPKINDIDVPVISFNEKEITDTIRIDICSKCPMFDNVILKCAICKKPIYYYRKGNDRVIKCKSS